MGSLRRTLTGSFRFSGRSSNSDLLAYLAAVVALDLAIGFGLMIGLDYERFAIVQDALQVLFFVPVPALLARRLHDQDRTASFLWLALPGIAFWLFRKAMGLTLPLAARVKFDAWAWPIDIVSIFTTMALVIMILLPGTVGPNRFGADPRRRE